MALSEIKCLGHFLGHFVGFLPIQYIFYYAFTSNKFQSTKLEDFWGIHQGNIKGFKKLWFKPKGPFDFYGWEVNIAGKLGENSCW